MSFSVTRMSLQKRERSNAACLRCRGLHRKCVAKGPTCELCVRQSASCVWDNKPQKKQKRRSQRSVDSEMVFAKMFHNSDVTKPQFVCATQPLASLLSRDSILCFDGDAYGLFMPWRCEQDQKPQIDEGLMKYLDSKDAFAVPAQDEQKYLAQLYLDNLYPLYPVVSKRSLQKDLKARAIPLILLNAIFLCSVRFDTTLDPSEIRERLNTFYERCKLLELVETNKVVLIQAYCLLSLQEEGMEGSSTAKTYISKACNICGDLAITTMGISAFETSPNQHMNKQGGYSKSLLKRIFWTCFCCDRMISATSAREIILNRKDLYIDEINASDFGDELDFKIFKSWQEICVLIERIQFSLYRPPTNRTFDPKLKQDIEHWTSPSELASPQMAKFANFLAIAHKYAHILYLRREIDSVSLLLRNSDPQTPDADSESDQMDDTMRMIHKVSETVMDLVEQKDLIQHIVLVHVVLHIIALLELELKTQIECKPNFEAYFNKMAKRAFDRLKTLRDYWWFAGSAFLLCETVFRNDNSS